uniref:hypothetical protein n=1 Tax=Bacillus subtilis TaxID=1423 RepID=UPI00254DF901
ITDKLSAIGCLKGVLIPVSKTGVSPPYWHKGFYVTINRKREMISASAETQIKGRYVDAGNRVKTIIIKSLAMKGC